MEAVLDKIEIEKYPAYKDSGVEWLGDLPQHWEVKKIKFIGNIYAGLTGKKGDDFNKDFIPGIKSYIPFTNICNNHKISEEQFHFVKIDEKEKQNKVCKNDILFLMSSETLEDIARCSIYLGNKEELYLNSFCKGFRINDINVNPEYINYLFLCSTYRSYFSLVGRGFTRINLKQEYINNAFSLFPPKAEQTSIAQFLDQKTALIDKAISIKEKQIELFKERRQILIHNAVTKGLNPNIKMKDSGVEWIGEIPEHWELVNNRALFKERNEPGNPTLPILSVSIHNAVSSEELSEEENLRGKIRIEDKRFYKLVKLNDIAFNMMRAWQGAIGAVRTEGMVSPAYIVAKPKEIVNSDFFEYQYRTISFIQQMDRYSKGITDFRKRLYWNEFKQLKTILPSLKEQKEVVEFIKIYSDKIFKAISLKEKEIEKLKEFKATLINSAVTGKIKVS
jgi:type I restriction enzyme S subunit